MLHNLGNKIWYIIVIFLLIVGGGVLYINKMTSYNSYSNSYYDCSDFIYDKNTQTLNIHVSANGHGIGNRLKKLFSYMRYYTPKTVNLYWPDEGWVTAKFDDLFKFDYPVNLIVFNHVREVPNNRRFCLAPLERNRKIVDVLYQYIKDYRLLVAKTDFIDTKPFNVDAKFNIIPENIVEIYANYFKHITPSKKVLKRLKDININDNVVTIQVRTNEDWQNYFGGVHELDAFYEKMNKYPDDTIFYLSAMSKEVASEFYKRFPNRIIELPNKDYHSMIDATADMFILGSTKETLCSFESTFCEVGWYLNGAKSKVTVIGDDKNWKIKISIDPIIDSIPSN